MSAEKTSAPAEHPRSVYLILSAAPFTCPQGTIPALYIPVKDPTDRPFLTPLHHIAYSFIEAKVDGDWAVYLMAGALKEIVTY